MKTYQVHFTVSESGAIDVQADSQQDALNKISCFTQSELKIMLEQSGKHKMIFVSINHVTTDPVEGETVFA